jgi:hypothetical protein
MTGDAGFLFGLFFYYYYYYFWVGVVSGMTWAHHNIFIVTELTKDEL